MSVPHLLHLGLVLAASEHGMAKPRANLAGLEPGQAGALVSSHTHSTSFAACLSFFNSHAISCHSAQKITCVNHIDVCAENNTNPGVRDRDIQENLHHGELVSPPRELAITSPTHQHGNTRDAATDSTQGLFLLAKLSPLPKS